jgi:hypothetical protein
MGSNQGSLPHCGSYVTTTPPGRKETAALSTQGKDQYQEYLTEDPIDPPSPPKKAKGERKGRE